MLTFSFLLNNIGSTWARNSPYVLDVRVLKDKHGNDKKHVQLRNARTQRVVWAREVYYLQKAHWSGDRRAVAVESISSVLVWREGYKLRHFLVPGGRDYLMGCVWSPDKRHLLVRCGSSGSSDSNMGSLFCLRLGAGSSYKYFPISGGVFDMRWRGNRTVLYDAMDYNTKGEGFGKSYVWRIPAR
jgi:hypothetical protein